MKKETKITFRVSNDVRSSPVSKNGADRLRNSGQGCIVRYHWSDPEGGSLIPARKQKRSYGLDPSKSSSRLPSLRPVYVLSGTRSQDSRKVEACRR